MKKTLVYSQTLHSLAQEVASWLNEKSVDSHIWDNLVPIILRTTISIPTLTVVRHAEEKDPIKFICHP